MGDYKKLCEDLRRQTASAAAWSPIVLWEAAEAVEKLQIEIAAMRGAANSYKAENERLEKLRADASKENERLKRLIGEQGQDLWSAGNQRAEKLQAENERLKKQLDAAVEDLREYPGITPCHLCMHWNGKGKGPSKHCRIAERSCFEWRGVREDKA